MDIEMKSKENAGVLAVFSSRAATRRDCGGRLSHIGEWRRVSVCASIHPSYIHMYCGQMLSNFTPMSGHLLD